MTDAPNPNPRAQEYLRKAREADEMAALCKDGAAAQTFTELAERWRELAKHASTRFV